MSTGKYLTNDENLARLRELRAALRNRDYAILDQEVLDTAEAAERLRHERAARARRYCPSRPGGPYGRLRAFRAGRGAPPTAQGR